MALRRGSDEQTRPLVMLVEDDAAIAQMYQMGLQAHGFEVIVLADGSSLFEAIDVQIPDVAVLDWQLSGLLTGIDIIENLRLDERTCDLPIVMLTNHQDRADGEWERARRAGAREWLIKAQTSPSRLAARLERALQPIAWTSTQ